MSAHRDSADVADGKTVKELKAKIKNLESENIKLLNKVHHPADLRCTNHKIPDTVDEDDLENSILDLDEFFDLEQTEDEWLYVSPQLPPTPVHKKMTPRQWLSEGHRRGEEDNLLSLDDVRKNLVQDIDEAEDMNEIFNPETEVIQQTRGVRKGERRGGGGKRKAAEAVPVVNWKAKVVPHDDEAEDEVVPQRKWKVKQVPSVAPSSQMVTGDLVHHEATGIDEYSMLPEQTGARKPATSEESDVPVVKWKPKMPKDAGATNIKVDVPVVKWKPKMPTDAGATSREVVSPEDSDVPVVKWKPRMPTDAGATSREIASPEDSDVPVVKWKPKVPTDNANLKSKALSPENSDVPVVKGRANMPIDHNIEGNSDSHHNPSLPLKAQGGQLQRSLPKNVRNARSRAKVPNGSAHTVDNDVKSDATHSENDYNTRISRYASHHNSPSSSMVSSPAHHPPVDDTPHTSLSRRSSFSDSRSPSPPSISPQVRMAIGSPVSRRRTPSPARSLNRQSPSHSPVRQRKQIQLLSMNHQLIPGSRSSAGIPLPGSKLRNPRSHPASGSPAAGGFVKGGSPMTGPSPSSDKKQKRILPSPPSAVMSTTKLNRAGERGTEKSSQKPQTPGLVAKRPINQASPVRDAAGEDEDSWLEGCF